MSYTGYNAAFPKTNPTKRKNILEKKIPRNPRYENVQPTVDTGNSLTHYMRKIEDFRHSSKSKLGEIFKRMKITTFSQLIVQVHTLNSEPFDEDEEFKDDVESEVDVSTHRDSMDTSRSTLQSVTGGRGELESHHKEKPDTMLIPETSSLPYLLLDIRSLDDFQRCHIITAISYPKAYLSRATNYEIKQMLAFKNVPGKIIIIYDEDETLAIPAAETLVQRGYDNLFLLSGGLQQAWKKFPEGLLTGSPPSSITKRKQLEQQEPASQETFSPEDVNKIEIYLDNALLDNSVGSRLSKATSSLSNRTILHSSRTSNISKKPFRV